MLDGKRFLQRRKRSRPAPVMLTPSIRIDVDESYQLRHWTKQFGVSDVELRDAVEKVGPLAENVREYLLRR